MLVESMDNDERSADFDQYRRQAKQLFQTMSRTSEQSGLVTTGNFYFLYLIDNDVCYLTFCDQSYPKKLAYSFLEELKKEFDIQHSGEIAGTKRPYAFEKFGSWSLFILPSVTRPCILRTPLTTPAHCMSFME
jgi:vesicle transport protein SEC22